MEDIWMLVALVLCFAVVLVKVAAGRAIALMERRIANVGQEKQQALNELKVAASQKKILDANRATLEKKKTRLNSKRSRLDRELTEFESEIEHRERMRDSVRGKLIRPTRASGGGGPEFELEEGVEEE